MITTPIEQRPVAQIYIVNDHSTNGNGNGFTPPEGAHILPTEESRETNIKALSGLLLPGLDYEHHVKGGDGTAGWVVETVLLSSSGNKNDIHLEGEGYKDDLRVMTVAAGGSLALKPLIIEKHVLGEDAPGEDQQQWATERVAAYSFGVGRIAVGAKIVNSEDFRAEKAERIERYERWLPQSLAKWVGNLVSDLKLVRQVFGPQAEVAGDTWPANAEINGRTIGALVASNGQWMSGKWMRFRQQKLENEGHVISWVGDKPASVLFGMLLRAGGLHPMRDVQKIGGATYFTIKKRTLAQADGEDFELEPGTYRIRQADETVTLKAKSRAKPS